MSFWIALPHNGERVKSLIKFLYLFEVRKRKKKKIFFNKEFSSNAVRMINQISNPLIGIDRPNQMAYSVMNITFVISNKYVVYWKAKQKCVQLNRIGFFILFTLRIIYNSPISWRLRSIAISDHTVEWIISYCVESSVVHKTIKKFK